MADNCLRRDANRVKSVKKKTLISNGDYWTRRLVMLVEKCIAAQRDGNETDATLARNEVSEFWTTAENGKWIL